MILFPLLLLWLMITVNGDDKNNPGDGHDHKTHGDGHDNKNHEDGHDKNNHGDECPHLLGDENPVAVPLGVLLPDQLIPELLPAIRLALGHIKEHHCILNGYRMQMIAKDTQCKTSLGMKALFDLMKSEQRPIALFGDACTDVNEVVAMAAKYFSKILQLSYAETHAKFAGADSQELYPTFFRIVPGDVDLISARCHLVEHFKWTRVGTIKQSDDARFALPHEALTARLDVRYGIRVVYTASLSSDELDNIGYELDTLKEKDVRVLIGDFDAELAVQVLCEAYHRTMFGDNYVWILPGYHNPDWWINPSSSTNCTIEEMAMVIEGHFSSEYSTFTNDDRVTVSGLGVKKIRETLNMDCEVQDIEFGKCRPSPLRGFAYDGIWTLALAFDQVALDYESEHGDRWNPLTETTSEQFATRFLAAVSNVTFEGATGTVRFEKNERRGLIDISHWRNGSNRLVGRFNGADQSFRLYSYQFHDWSAPLDATIVVRYRIHVDKWLLTMMGTLAVLGLALASVFLFFNIKFRNHRFIKMSSPNMNNLITIGSMLAYLSVILLGLDTRFVSDTAFVSLCYAKTWSLSIGFTLAFGSMFSKTWRVHSIFTNIRMNKKAIKDSKLLLIVGLILLIDAVVLILWAVMAPFSFSLHSLPGIAEVSRVIEPELEQCRSENAVVYQALLIGFKGLLMILGCFLAWETRHVNVPALNDSQYIGMSVYNVVVMCVLGVAIVFILQEKVNESYGITCFFIIFCTTLTLCLVFVPKMIELIRNPKNSEPRFRKGMMKSVVGGGAAKALSQNRDASSHSQKSPVNDRERLMRMEQENQLLHRFLQEKTIQLREVMQKMREAGLNPRLGGDENNVEDEQHDEAIQRREEQEGGASPSSSTLLLLNTAPHPLAHNSSRINHGCNGSTTLISSSDERGDSSTGFLSALDHLSSLTGWSGDDYFSINSSDSSSLFGMNMTKSPSIYDFQMIDDDLVLPPLDQDNFYLDDEESTIVTLRRYSSSSSREQDNAITSQDSSPGEQLNPSSFQLTTADHATFRRFSTSGDDQQQ